jgi:hypothetical protein
MLLLLFLCCSLLSSVEQALLELQGENSVGCESCRYFNKDDMQETVGRFAALSVLLSRRHTLQFSTDLCGSRLFQTLFLSQISEK